jgi:hypothetical protein
LLSAPFPRDPEHVPFEPFVVAWPTAVGKSGEAGTRRMEPQPAALHRGSVTSAKGTLLTSDAAKSAAVTTRAVNLGVYWRGPRGGQAV